jgi:hypothetical protein
LITAYSTQYKKKKKKKKNPTFFHAENMPISHSHTLPTHPIKKAKERKSPPSFTAKK